MTRFSDRLREAMAKADLRQADICRMTGLDRSAISSYLSGRYAPSGDNLTKIARAVNVSEAWLLGYDTPEWEKQPLLSAELKKQLWGLSTTKLPMLGKVACGMPIYCDEERESYIMVGSELKADCCLRAVGDSMINARIHDGDIVFIRYQPMVNNGEIAAVVIDDSITLKRVYYYPEQNKLVLQAENPVYAPLVYDGSELETIHILGKAVAFQSDVR